MFALALALFCCFSYGLFSNFTKTLSFIKFFFYMDPGGGLSCPKMVEAFFANLCPGSSYLLGRLSTGVFSRFFWASSFDWFRGFLPPIVASMLLGNAWTRAPGQPFRLDLGSSSFHRDLLAWEAVHRRFFSRFFWASFFKGRDY